MKRTLILLAIILSFSNGHTLETTEGIKKDFNHFKNKVVPEKKAKIKKKIAEISDKINSKVQEKTN